MLGILALETSFPRIAGDVGCAATFAFPVRIAVVKGASVDAVVHRARELLLSDFIDAGRMLAAHGCLGIVTTCGFLARWQRELADAIPVPVMTSALLTAPLVERTLPRGRRVGIVTYSDADLTRDVLAGVGLDAATPVAGVGKDSYFARTIRDGATTLDTARMAADTVAAARVLVDAHSDVGAIVLECANMPPYARAVRAATGLAVHDAAQAFAWFHAGLAGHGPADLW
ncbi:MAG TPA: aspartate/glutamate racemase family protein [Casimicrobiaceae bacterium]|nr:aspartate/glutamate racemase family protein [Casimicrobiaceae bacterium]